MKTALSVSVVLLLCACFVTASTTPAPSTSATAPAKPIPTVTTSPSVNRTHMDEGGETCANAVVIGILPFADGGNTCDNVNDYDEACPWTSTSPDVVYSYTPTADIEVTIDLCNSGYDTKVYVYQDYCVSPYYDAACNDDACGADGYKSKLTCIQLYAGHTYHIVVDGYGGECGTYELLVTECVPCFVVCPPLADPEGEPPCGPGYVDNFNGGCNSDPPVFSPMDLAHENEVCGTSGTYLFEENDYRDTDWYRLVVTEARELTWSAVGEFPILIFIIKSNGEDCNNLELLGYDTADPCDTARVTVNVPPDVYYLWVGPSVFAGIPCDVDYVGMINSPGCQFQLFGFDMGDMPSCNYPTVPMNPARGVTNIAWLGESINAEQFPNILDQDLFDDGVVFVNRPWRVCESAAVIVTVTGGPQYNQWVQCGGQLFLSAWKDGNLNGDFCDTLCTDQGVMADEWIIQDAPVTPGSWMFLFNDPGVPELVPYDGFFRFILSVWQPGRQGFGLIDNIWCPYMDCGTLAWCCVGEVEDYIITDLQWAVELTSFAAVPGSGEVTLNWATGSETNNDHFELSRDGAVMAVIPTQGNGPEGHTYTFSDRNLANGTTYTYALAAVDVNGAREELGTATATPLATAATIAEYALLQNYPNPFNASTTITYDLVEGGFVTLKVYNVMGQEIATLMSGAADAGRHTVHFDATNLASGVYLYRLNVNGFTAEKKMLLMR